MATDELHTLAEEVGALLLARGWRLGLGESCTGGLVGHVLTNIPGSSAFFQGGVIAYANDVKRDVLGVPEEALLTHGAVSAPVAVAMARGARRVVDAEVGISITGIAGPTGGTPEKPVGTVYIGYSSPLGEGAERYRWEEDRLGNKVLSARAALEVLRDLLMAGTAAAG